MPLPPLRLTLLATIPHSPTPTAPLRPPPPLSTHPHTIPPSSLAASTPAAAASLSAFAPQTGYTRMTTRCEQRWRNDNGALRQEVGERRRSGKGEFRAVRHSWWWREVMRVRMSMKAVVWVGVGRGRGGWGTCGRCGLWWLCCRC